MPEREQQEPETVYGPWDVDEDGYLVCRDPRGDGWSYTGTAAGENGARGLTLMPRSAANS